MNNDATIIAARFVAEILADTITDAAANEPDFDPNYEYSAADLNDDDFTDYIDIALTHERYADIRDNADMRRAIYDAMILICA
jgi:hypothetical protein